MKKVGYFFYSFLPLLATIALQTLIGIPLIGFCMMYVVLTNRPSGPTGSYSNVMERLMDICTSQTFTLSLSIVYALSGIFIFGYWYRKQFAPCEKLSPKKLLRPQIIISIILMVPVLQFLASYLSTFVASLFPHWMEYYQKLMDSVGLGESPGLLLVVYAVILGPIEEELTFRGVAMGAAKRAMPFWAANILQAALFGIFHMNMIQGIYAFFIGLFCGYVYEKGGSIYLAMLLHILFNLWGTFFPSDFPFGNTPIGASILIIGSVFVGLLALHLFTKGTQKNLSVEDDV